MNDKELIAEARHALSKPQLGRNVYSIATEALLILRRTTDALESAEARIAELEEALDARQPTEDDRDFELEAVLRDGFSRTTVPDAATERIAELESELENAVRTGAQIVAVCRGHDVARTKAEAERDAALAAVKRVKHLLAPIRNRLGEHGEVPLRYAVSKTLELLATLDGAPEPEWEVTK